MAAVRHAVANGNWSNVATWDGGAALPTAGDTVYANNKAVTIDQDIDLNSNPATVAAGSFVTGCRYRIKTAGTTNWTAIGAVANTAGVTFTATGAGTGTGDAYSIGTLVNGSLASPSITQGGGFTTSGTRVVKADIVGAGGATPFCFTVASNTTLTGNVFWGFGTGSRAITINANQTLTLTGDIGTAPNMGNGTGAAHGIDCASNANVYLSVTGTVNGGIANSSTAQNGIYATSSGSTLVVTGNVNSHYVSNSDSGRGVYWGSGTVTVTGDLTGGYADAVVLSGSGTVVINGNCTGSSTSSQGSGLNASSCTSITVNGSITGGSQGTTPGAVFSSNTAVTVNGTVTGGTDSGNSAPGISATGTQTLTVVGTVNATTTNHAIEAAIGTTLRVDGDLNDASNGVTALYARKLVTGTEAGHKWRKALNGSSTYTYWAADFDHAAEADVRNGTLYASGTRTGTCHVPAPDSVAAGTPVDDTVGTAVLTGAQIPGTADIAAAVRTELAAELARVANCATVASTGEQIAAFETA